MLDTIWVAFLSGIITLIFAVYLIVTVMKKSAGNSKMQEISTAIKQGATAYLLRQYKTLLPYLILLFLLVGYFINWSTGIAFLIGVVTSGLAGFIGMMVSVRANVRTAEAAKNGLNDALSVAFKGGSVTGLMLIGLCLVALSVLFWLFNSVNVIIGFGFGASLISLFARVGGGIYTKAADVGADLVGKVEKNIPEDDPRNPAVIADNVGDNVGDCAGMAADLFESYGVTVLAAMLLGVVLDQQLQFSTFYTFLPLLIASVGALATIIGLHFVRLGKSKSIMKALYKGLWATALFAILGFYLVTAGDSKLFYTTLIGVLVTILIFKITEYYTSKDYYPVQSIANASKTGAGTNLIQGLAIGLQSTALPVLLIVGAIILSYNLAGLYGIALAAVSMLSMTGIVIALDAYGPITDNAGGIAEMSGLPANVRKITDELDAVGNTTKATTKGFAIAGAALGALALFAAFAEAAHVQVFNLLSPAVVVGLFIGGMIPFIFASLIMKAVGNAAFSIVEEVRRQFKTIKGLMAGKAKPDYAKCVDICTKASLSQLLIPGLIAVLAPLLVGFILGPEALGGLLAGSIVSGFLLAIMMATSGAAWDNAKKYVEEGHFGGKGSDAHKAAVVGDTVGDPEKDSAAPALNSLIKVLNTMSLLFAGAMLMYGLHLL